MPYVLNTPTGTCRWVDPPYELNGSEKFLDTQPKTDTPISPDLHALYESLNTRLSVVEDALGTKEKAHYE